MSNPQEVKFTDNAFEYGYKVGDVVAWGSYGEIYVVSEDGCAYDDNYNCLEFRSDPKTYTLVKSVKETIMNQYKTTITTTISLEQGQVESILVKALGLGGQGVTIEWNQDGSVEVSYMSKE